MGRYGGLREGGERGGTLFKGGLPGSRGKEGEGSADPRQGAVCPSRLPAERSGGSG